MASLRPRKDTGQLFFDFRWQGKRYRAQTDFPDTAESRKVLAPKLTQLNEAIARGAFAMDTFFPELGAHRLKAQGAPTAPVTTNARLAGACRARRYREGLTAATGRHSCDSSCAAFTSSDVIEESRLSRASPASS